MPWQRQPQLFKPALSPVSQSGSAGVMGWLGAKMQSWELLSELFISLRASLKNISEGAREILAASDPACSPQKQRQPLLAGTRSPAARKGWDDLRDPQREQFHGRKSSHAVCGCPRVKWVSPGTGDVPQAPFGACLAEVAFSWQPHSCSERRGTEPVLVVGQSPSSSGRSWGALSPHVWGYVCECVLFRSERLRRWFSSIP